MTGFVIEPGRLLRNCGVAIQKENTLFELTEKYIMQRVLETIY
jgi:hypothetical protein